MCDRHVLESKDQSGLVIPAVFLHQELPIRLSHALNMLNSNLLPFNMSEIPTIQHIARSYLEDISLVTQMPKPSTPQLEEEFTAILRNLEHRQNVKMLAISQGFKELLNKSTIQTQSKNNVGTSGTDGQSNDGLQYHNDSGRRTVCPQVESDIQKFFNRFYTINIGTRLLIGEHLALHDHGLNLVQRVNPLTISRGAIKAAQRVCSTHYGQPAPPVLIQASNPDISTTYIEEFLHHNIYELLKNSMRATCEAHLQEGSPVSLGMTRGRGSGEGTATAAVEPKLPPITLTLVDGGEDVSIKISDQGAGLALSELDKIWSYVHLANSAATLPQIQQSTSSSSSSLSSPVLSSESKNYLDLPLSGSGHGLPLARLIARYFGGELSLISMDGHGTDSYLSLYKDDDHLENFPEMNQEMLDEVDVFVNELLDIYISEKTPPTTPATTTIEPQPKSTIMSSPDTRSLPSNMVLGLKQTNAVVNSMNKAMNEDNKVPLDISTIPLRSDTASPNL
ncbi:hypothetical protein BGZ80_003977 [Entomortierella chlamydospora]|uniref:Protein-serine/threonine kinase n=1 Tax=Entomortierella chlamydospora TaxID=101097 RepID=A0A9P6SWC5_9FUNG|nr:hypothetical protein BGZ80_003977 [Entomortierella chlamydospora]